MSIVVVGVDGSEHADAALRFAAEEAALRGATLRVVCGWQLPPSVTMDMGLAPGLFESFREEAETIVREAAEMAASLQPEVPRELRVVEGHAVEVLRQEAKDAVLLVVGTRGRSELAGIFLGSVSHHLLSQATCPVTVVPKK